MIKSEGLVTAILSRLRQIGIRTELGRIRKINPNNYRHYNPPYGYKVKDNKLVLDNSEMKICRLFVELMDRQKKGAREAARELMNQKFKNRRGEVTWGHFVVQQIFKQWKNKI